MTQAKQDGRRVDDRDWSVLTPGERIRHVEMEGYLVIPDLLSSEQIASLKLPTEALETAGRDYSLRQRSRAAVEFEGGAITELIAHPPTIGFLTELFGCQPIMMTYDYSRSEPGCPAINLHADGQPWGTKIFGPEQSCPRLVRVLYYLQDLTPERAPFRVVPRSHLTFHNDGNPYLRYRSHPEQVMVTARAGDACLINQNVFHGNFENRSAEARDMLGIAYRPSWAGPFAEVDPWPVEELAKASPAVRAALGDRNQRIWFPDADSVPSELKEAAPGIDPSRWERA